jgi:two-component system sensor histidine kinase RegB
MFISNLKSQDDKIGFQDDLFWLIRLRWCAVVGQSFTCLASWSILRLDLPYSLLTAFITLTATSNGILEFLKSRAENHSPRLCGVILVWDTFILTAMLYWGGGHHNPFSAFYLLHVTLGAILLSSSWVWWLVLQCALCSLILFVSPHCLHAIENSTDSFDLHLHGMWVALVLVASFIAYFVKKLSNAFAERNRELTESRIQTVRMERFSSLATLAAGVAHEMATPLSTIAVASSDLSHRACELCKDSECKTDATLIRQEVDRCRYILEKLSLETSRSSGQPPEMIPCSEIPSAIRPYLKPQHFQQTEFTVDSSVDSFLLPQLSLLQSLAALIKNGCEASRFQKHLFVRLKSQEEGVLIEVQDEGEGMNDETLSKISEPFFTTKPPGSGMGLGLFLVRMFAEQMKGTLDIQSERGRGTRVSLWIPMKTTNTSSS